MENQQRLRPVDRFDNRGVSEYLFEAARYVSITGISLGIYKVDGQWVLVQIPKRSITVN